MTFLHANDEFEIGAGHADADPRTKPPFSARF
jgi:hypothetical protein